MSPPPARLIRALDSADPAIRLYLLRGPDEAGARALGARIATALGADAERIDLASAALEADPARLADEAAAIALFGGRRWIRIDPATDEAADAVAALLDAPAAGNPVVAIAPSLRKDARLIKLAQGHEAAITHACYLPEGRDADALAIELGRGLGLQLHADAARRVAGAAGGDRALIERELEKFALYLDAAPDRPRLLEGETLDALGLAVEEGDLGRLTGAVFAGDLATVDHELGRLAAEGIEGIPVLRALVRRALQLAQLGAQIAEGEGLERVMATAGRSIYRREQGAVRRALACWDPAGIATALARLAAAERQVKAPGYAGGAVVAEEVFAIARAAARRR